MHIYVYQHIEISKHLDIATTIYRHMLSHVDDRDLYLQIRDNKSHNNRFCSSGVFCCWPFLNVERIFMHILDAPYKFMYTLDAP